MLHSNVVHLFKSSGKRFRLLPPNKMKKETKDALSPFGRFVVSTKGYDFRTRKGRDLDKWEVFEMGFTDLSRLLSNRHPEIIATKRPESLRS